SHWGIERSNQHFIKVNGQSNNMPTHNLLWPLMLIDSCKVSTRLPKQIQDHRTPPLTCSMQSVGQHLQILSPQTGRNTMLCSRNQRIQTCIDPLPLIKLPKMSDALRLFQSSKTLLQILATLHSLYLYLLK